MPTKILQILQIGILQEIKTCAELACRELIKVTDDQEEIQQNYTTSLQEKIAVEGKVYKALKEKAQKASENISTLPLVERMMIILKKR